MCVIVGTVEFVPALIDCVYEDKKRSHFVISEEVLWRMVKELQKRCWSNVNMNYEERDRVVASLCYVFGDDFVSIGSQNEIMIKGMDDSIKKIIASYFYSVEKTWYKELGKAVHDCLAVTEEGSLRFHEPANREGYNTPQNILKALDQVYPESLLSALA